MKQVTLIFGLGDKEAYTYKVGENGVTAIAQDFESDIDPPSWHIETVNGLIVWTAQPMGYIVITG